MATITRKEIVSKSPFKHPWWHAYGGIGDQIRCLDEWLIIELSNTIRSKPDWTRKFKDQEIVKKWRDEFNLQKLSTKHPNEIFDYVLRELEWYDTLQSTVLKEGHFKIGPDDRIVFSDEAIDAQTARKFSLEASKFEKATPKDFHPGSNETVVDLVHPSLYLLEYGRTKILENGVLKLAEFSEEISTFKKGISDWGVSKKYQWLPALMSFDRSTQKFSFESYINNLDPVKFATMYDEIGAIFNQVVPGLNFSLARYLSEQYIRVEIPSYTKAYNDDFAEYEEKLEELWELSDYDAEREQALEDERPNYLRDFPPIYKEDPSTDKFDIRDFSNLKVIVKLANIELTPEKQKYPGGAWHVEGTINENIVATVLYYYDMENIKDSKLSFRAAYEDPHYEQGDTVYCERFFGLLDEDKMTHHAGSVDAKKDRVIVFPNYFQHHVDPFELEDPLKPGFRKILCFFLVDPYDDLVKTTKEVPPQQKDWVDSDAIMSKYFPSVDRKELSTISWEEATKLREDFMKERSVNEEKEDFENPFTRSFSLCEH